MIGTQEIINTLIGVALVIYGADVMYQNGTVSLKNARIIVALTIAIIFIYNRPRFEGFEGVSWVGQSADEKSGPGIGMGLSSYARAPLMIGADNDDVAVEGGVSSNGEPDLGDGGRIFVPRGGSTPEKPGVRSGNNDTKWLTTGAGKVVTNEPTGTEQEFNVSLSSVVGF